jgi:hypothetical protein
MVSDANRWLGWRSSARSPTPARTSWWSGAVCVGQDAWLIDSDWECGG